jgi:hypothetical protein
MENTDIREEAKRLISRLGAEATWEDVARAIDARILIEQGMADSRAGRVRLETCDVRKRFGLAP